MKKLMLLARFQFLLASLALFILGACWAILLSASFSLSRMLLGYLIILPAHLSVSFSNDYFDVETDKFGSPAIFSGGSGILVNHPELRKTAKWIAIMLIFCSLVVGYWFISIYSYSIWFLGYIALCDLLGWYYSAPPLSLAYRGLGELSTTLTAGFLVPGMGYLVMNGYLDIEGLLFAIPLLLYGLAFILAVEIPDMEMDRLGNKKTWVARKGRSFGFIVVGFLLLAATGFFSIFPWVNSRAFPVDFHLLLLFSVLPLGAGIIGALKRPIEQKTATKYVNGIIITLAMFFILTDGYFILMLTR